MDDLKAECISNGQVHVKEEVKEDDNIKEEPEWEDSTGFHGISAAAARAGLYANHEVKDELVLGPEGVQPPDIAFTLYARQASAARAQPVLRDCVARLDARRPERHVAYHAHVGNQVHSHANIHKEKQTYVCDICNKRFALKTRLVEHVMIHIHQGPEQGESKHGILDNGQARHLAAKKTESSKTNKRKAPLEDKKEKLNEKIAKTSSEKINSGTSAPSQDLSSSTDVQEVTPEKPAGSSSSGEVNTLTAEANFKCEKCGKGFNIKSDLERHLNTHMLMEASTSHKVSKFTCKTCNCTFDTKLLLQEHEKSRHGVKYLACDECDYATKYASKLQTHLRTHTGEKPFKCSRCSSAFTQSGHLQSHLKTHTGEKPFKCIQCSSAFSRSSDLQRHLRTHTGEKPYKCSQCSSAFSQNNDLRAHLRTHTGDKPFECNICDYKTTRSFALKSHLMSRHSGRKPFGCDACSYRGATRGHLRLHMKRCHKSA